MASTSISTSSLFLLLTASRFASKPFFSSTPLSLIFNPKLKRNRYRLFSVTSMASSSEPNKESPSNNPGLHVTPDDATKGYLMQQTMFRIKDPKVSLDFYSRVLGMSLLKRLDFPEMKFSLYFLGYEDLTSAPSDSVERTVWTFSKKATIELTHNWGTESDPEFKGYHNGNSDPRGFECFYGTTLKIRHIHFGMVRRRLLGKIYPLGSYKCVSKFSAARMTHDTSGLLLMTLTRHVKDLKA